LIIGIDAKQVDISLNIYMCSVQVSIIIPCYNCADYLSDCLDSIIAQTFKDWECIVIDDGSTDNVSDLVKEYRDRDSRFRIISQGNRGPSAARNVGFNSSVGDWLLFLDGDDVLEPRVLESRIACAHSVKEESTNGCVVYGPYRYFGNKSNARPQLFKKRHGNEKYSDILHQLIEGNIFAINSLLISRKSVERVGGFDESLRGVEDWDLWLRMALDGMRFWPIEDDDASCALVRVHGVSLSASKLYMIEWELQARTKWSMLLSEKNKIRLIKENNRRILHRTVRLALYDLLSHEVGEAKRKFFYVIYEKGLVWCFAATVRNLIGMIIKSEIKFADASRNRT